MSELPSQMAKKRLGQAGRRPVADVLIEAFVTRFQGSIDLAPVLRTKRSAGLLVF